MKILKKSLAIFLTLALCLSAMLGCLSVSAEGTALTLVLDKDTYAPGETVRIAVTAADFADIKGAEFQINLGALTDVAVENGAITIVPDNEEVEPNVWVNGSTVKFVDTFEVASGVLFTVVAKAPATVGDVEVTVTDAKFGVSATDLADITVAPVTVVVKEAHVCNMQVNKDETGHWTECTCGVKTDVVPHTFGEYTDNGDGTETATCECGWTDTRDIPVTEPEKIDFTLKHDIMVGESVYSKLTINVSATAGGLKNLGYADYYLVFDYQKYGNGYKLEDKKVKRESDSFDSKNASGSIHYYEFKDVALYEMALNYTVSIYMLDANGNVVAYDDDVTSIAKQAKAYADKYPTNTVLLTALVDMVNFGAAAQEQFAAPDNDLYGATLANADFEEYKGYASDVSKLPTEYNNTKESVKTNPDTTITTNGTITISSSNVITYSINAYGYDKTALVGNISYVDAYNRTITDTIDFSKLTPREVSSGGKNYAIYSYVFSKLALYDLDKTVTLSVVYEGGEEIVFTYSAGNFITSNINNATYSNILTKMVLFSQSVAEQLGV